MASRREQKEAARLAREQAHAQLKAEQAQKTRLMLLAGVLAIVIAAAVVVIIASSSGGGGGTGGVNTQRDGAPYTHAAADAEVATLLNGIPQSGNELGSPIAPVTITEFGDLVCPICDTFATGSGSGPGSEQQLISTDVRSGKVKMLFRADETASGRANGSMFVKTQTAARSAGLQDKEWNFILLTYDEQPATIGGQDAELEPYVTLAYLKNRAAQIPGLNLRQWQANLTNATLVNEVNSDNAAAATAAPLGTPTIIVSGPKGSVTYDRSGQLSAVPTIAQLDQLIAQVS